MRDSLVAMNHETVTNSTDEPKFRYFISFGVNDRMSTKNKLPGLKCLTGSSIKLLGVVMMVFDHLHQMFFMFGIPIWFTWVGRLSAPLFLFMCAEGFYHTRSKGRYMLLLLAGFEFMNIASRLLSAAMPNSDIVLMNNIFGTLLLCTIYMWATDTLRVGIQKKRIGKVALSVLLIFAPVGIGVVFYSLFTVPGFIGHPYAQHIIFLLQLIPNMAVIEGGIPFVLLGLLFHLFREKRLFQLVALAAVALLSLPMGDTVQWMMIFAAIPIFLYSGTRGKGSKYFFYIFYPAHIYMFYIISCLLT
jgi:hypothetical protein